MEKKTVVFVRSNTLDIDIRLPKEIKALSSLGFKSRLICWDRKLRKEPGKTSSDVEEISFRLKAPDGPACLLFLPLWWFFIFFKVLTTECDIVHIVNFDNFFPALLAGKIKGRPVVYEILDVYEDQIALPGLIRKMVLGFDKLLMRFASGIIVADEAQVNGIGGIPNHSVVPIYDSPPVDYGKAGPGFHRRPNDMFTLFYAGVLDRSRRLNLDKIFEILKEIEGVKLIVAGYGDLIDEINRWAKELSFKMEFIGKISYAEVIEIGQQSDLFFVLRDQNVPVNSYTCGSTMFNAMICGRPILVNRGGSTASKVDQEKCGLIVDADDLDEIRKAIIRLRDSPGLVHELGVNSRKAYETKYSWELMEKRLTAFYKHIAGRLSSQMP